MFCSNDDNKDYEYDGQYLENSKCSFLHRATAPTGPGLSYYRGFVSHSDTPQSVRFLGTSDQPDAENSTSQHTTPTRVRYPRPPWNSNPQSRKARECGIMP
jgi:hypothetical protein